ncbi:MAG: CRISPR-associated endonuclease Cas1 [bacterium]|nr:CRISPR-associated endonuclease Cas1 [bacterium]MXZ30486.1 CRISPR-associated endonuclease Cas1 [Acidimicrobiia bacterium]MYB24739.1 CRISPR-associated endonuclease Cas1 [Acidimicrobiia bacterium]MYE66716.1 CRISPR-associated endonuclease Cas1 [Acidimicrobiia bacterium]MYJ13958.1 CRISPR-associated endonuclease Cas1 [Acidimicrobiia bacterium]
MRYLSTVYVREHRAKVSFRRGSLLVSDPDGKKRIPLEAIDGVILIGAAQITTDALGACVERNVRVASLKRNGAIRFVVGGPTGGNVHLRSALYAAVSNPRHSLELSRSVVAGKLQNSRRVINRWARDEHSASGSDQLSTRADQIGSRVARLSGSPTADHIRGIEGDAARIYFGALKDVVAKSHLKFAARTRRPPRDHVNAMLGYCYGLLVTELIGALDAVGLDNQMGFFHRPRSGRPSLALDLAEELRPLVDRFVVTLVRRRQVGPESFVGTPGGAVYLHDDSRTDLIKLWEAHKDADIYHPVVGQSVPRWALPSIQATLLARHLRGDLPVYPPFLTSH